MTVLPSLAMSLNPDALTNLAPLLNNLDPAILKSINLTPLTTMSPSALMALTAPQILAAISPTTTTIATTTTTTTTTKAATTVPTTTMSQNSGSTGYNQETILMFLILALGLKFTI